MQMVLAHQDLEKNSTSRWELYVFCKGCGKCLQIKNEKDYKFCSEKCEEDSKRKERQNTN